MKAKQHSAAFHKQGGMTLIELGLVLAVVAIILTGSLIGYQTMMSRAAQNQSIQYITMISANAKQLFGQAGAYGDVTTEIAVRSGLIPRELRVPGTNTANNNYGVAITVAPGNGTGTNDLLVANWGGVPGGSVCSTIVRAVERELRRVVVGTTTVKPLDGALNTATTSTACDVNGVVQLEVSIGRS